MTDHELGWLAGIIDGEGCFYIHTSGISPNEKHRRTPQIRLSVIVTMCHQASIQHIMELAGCGTIIFRDMSKYGLPKNDNWMWRCADGQAGDFIRMVRPYLITKAEEADVALEFAALPKTKFRKGKTDEALFQKRMEYYHRLKALKPRNQLRAKMASTERSLA